MPIANRLKLVMATLLPCCGLMAANSAFDWFAVSDLVRIFDDGYKCPAPRRSIDVFGIRGETISAQCVLGAGAELRNVTVELSPLVPDSLPSVRLPANVMQWYFVGSVPLPGNTPGVRATHLTRLAPARFPDYLGDGHELASLAGGRLQAVWLTIKIPRDAAPGIYRSAVTVKTDRGSATLPLILTVYPPQMPDRRHLNVTFWYSTNRFATLHGVNESDTERFYEMLRIYAEDMAAHRQNVFRVSLSLIRANMAEAGKLSFDFSRFDRWADVFWNTGHMDRLETGFVAERGPGGWSDSTMPLTSWTVTNEAGERVKLPGQQYLKQFLPVFEQHLREKGWLDRTIFHIADEPVNWNVRSWRQASDLVHRYAPSLRRVDAIEGTDFSGALEIWVPKLPHLNNWFDVYKKAQREGNELWYYLAMPTEAYPNRFIDSPLIETRILYWLNYRFGLTGFLHWGFNSWTDNPFEKPSNVSDGADDAWTVYPKPGGLLDSLRWEATRNGLEDYEYLWLLENRIAEIKTRAGPGFSWIDPSQRGVELASRVIARMNVFTGNPEVLYDAKLAILRELLDLDLSPRLLVQSNPPEGSTVIDHTGLVEVFGLSDPGTTVAVNGKAVPVDESGYFATAVSLTVDQNVVWAEAKSAKGERSLQRSFRVIH